ncbi:MAG: alpha-ketoacid dehydrogenase subunit beta [Dehalococcoidia bacterium]
MTRTLSVAGAIREATDQALAADPRVYVIGLGAPDPKGIFGTTLGLAEAHGADRVLDMPASENAMTGIVIGSAIAGQRPILTHQRVDFALLSLDQLINNAAKWHAMFGGLMTVPLVVRMVIGRGWGQGPQHSQSLHGLFAQIPGLKVVAPATAHDAKGLLAAAVQDDNPVIYLEHRWLHHVVGEVPEASYTTPIGEARVARAGRDLTIVASSYQVLESLRAAEVLAEQGVDAEVVDLRTLRPLDEAGILASVRRTGRLLAVDGGWRAAGFAAEILAIAAEGAHEAWRAAPARITLPDRPTPTSWPAAQRYYPGVPEIVAAARRMLGLPEGPRVAVEAGRYGDQPSPEFRGPF